MIDRGQDALADAEAGLGVAVQAQQPPGGQGGPVAGPPARAGAGEAGERAAGHVDVARVGGELGREQLHHLAKQPGAAAEHDVQALVEGAPVGHLERGGADRGVGGGPPAVDLRVEDRGVRDDRGSEEAGVGGDRLARIEGQWRGSGDLRRRRARRRRGPGRPRRAVRGGGAWVLQHSTSSSVAALSRSQRVHSWLRLPDSVATRILSIDGGGIRGLIPALVLAHIEDQCQKPAAELFDVIAGTSTGGILALGLACPQPAYTARDLAGLYVDEGETIFPKRLINVRGLYDEKYSAAGLERVLADKLGDARLKDARTRVLVTSYDIERRAPVFFRSVRASEERRRRLPDARRGAGHVGRSDLLRARPAPRRPALRAGGRRGVRQQPRHVRLRGPRHRRRPRRGDDGLARHRAADPAAGLRRGQGLGPAGLGPAGARRGLRRRERHGRPPAGHAPGRPLPAPADRAQHRERRHGRRRRAQHRRPQAGGRGADRRQPRRAGRRSARG